MLLRKMKIPTVTGATLVLGGSCGGGGGDAAVDALATRVCNMARDCEPEEFASYFDSFAECERQAAADLQEYVQYYTTEYSAACARSYLRLYECYIDFYESRRICDEYYEAPPGTCADAYADFYAACPGAEGE
jgi:hypothetical protein